MRKLLLGHALVVLGRRLARRERTVVVPAAGSVRRNRFIILAAASFAMALLATAVATFVAWIFERRVGSGFVNRVIDPVLVERRISGAGASEIGTIEHIGRRSGTRRLTPIHPVATDDGFRIVVPLGDRSEWAQNVLAAGHCRLQLHDMVHELDEPVLLEPEDAPGLSRIATWLSSRLGFRYLTLHEFSSAPGSLLDSGPGASPDAPQVIRESIAEPARAAALA